ncbi:MAG: non-canonical purine NTP pyrophosphatase [Eubacterium sp.]|nr:non-canonical purine NTP pyrophosphatase [Eubacterium sp.]HCA22138.1 non-canonical purine NTP pyrophosphatase [Lachnospiraceae bacterium]
MKKLIFATGNKDKMREIRMIMAGLPYEVYSMKEVGADPDIVEDGTSFAENALIKARAVAEYIKANGLKLPEETSDEADGVSGSDEAQAEEIVVLADDSGLEIDALNKEPGIYSARYMGEDTSYHIKNKNLIDRLEGVQDEDRTARFVCAVAAVFSNGREEVREATMEGRIGYEEKGANGFGYDPILFLPQFGCMSAELEPEQKNAISHRGKALRMMRECLEEA